MKTNSIVAIILLALSSAAPGCASRGFDGAKTGTLQGMIYDYENRPAGGYIVTIDADRQASTDINGRFMIPGIPFGTHTLSGEGPNHCPLVKAVDFADKTQIFYFRIPSNSYLYAQVDRQLAEGDYGEAMASLRLFSADEQRGKKFNLYKTIALFRLSPADSRSGYYERARKLTGELLDE